MDVSIVIPLFNAEKTIISTLQSVLNQTFTGDLEILVVDDGSTDSSAQKVIEYLDSHPACSIKLIQQENKGVSSARNTGLRNAKGRWIALLDSDDEWLPNKLERQLEILNNYQDIDFLGTTRNNEQYKRVYFKKFDLISKISPRLLLYKFVFVVPTVIFKREIIDQIGYFDEYQRFAEEGNYFIRICQRFNCYLLNESLVVTGGGKAHFGGSGLSGNLFEMEKGELKNMRFAFKSQIIGFPEYLFLIVFSILKYLRRILIVHIRTKTQYDKNPGT